MGRRPILTFEDCHAVLNGTAGRGMADRVRDGLLHRLDVARRNAGSLPPEVEALRARLADDPAATREVFTQFKQEHPQLLAQHMVFANVDQLCHWLDMRPAEGVERVSKAVVVGGIHGNELSGMAVAGTIHDEHPESRVRTFSNGNPWAGMLISRRNLGDDGHSVDMNRIFPGDPNGTPEQQRAAEICSAAQKADLSIDLHEGLADWDQGRAGRLCIFHPTPQSLAFLKAFEPVLREHDFRLVPYRYDGTLVQEAGKGGAGVSLLFELPLSLDFDARTELGTKLVRSALHLGFHPPKQ
ncbi:MAG: succinylglutamate desuccinylase/aspartoacylase family protein [Candidatus Eremiobacteraeota bacterium]|nr:succinylglutamate desuccinylase/aspartoacylase family protein [Candidatus Eremiobacteraeota bacterium]